jgi:hypothetical protein
LLVSPLLVRPESAHAQSPTGNNEVTITYGQNNRITLTVFGVPPVVKQSDRGLDSSLTGSEQSQCQPGNDDRRSSTNASSSTSVTGIGSAHLTASFRISAVANGGHYRTCVAGCDPFRHCIGILPHDTRAEATVESSLQAKIIFSANIVQDFYDLKISSSLPKDLKIKITAPDGSVIFPSPSGVTRLSVKRNDVYYVDVSLSADAANDGGCCKDAKSLQGQFDLQLQKPPILESRIGMKPYIAGGVETSSYKYVAGILLRGKLHCSGTVVGVHTILTAAHCINGYEDEIAKGQMTYLLGPLITSPQYGPAAVSAGTYPRGTDAIQYNPVTYEHDIGLLFTPAAIPTPPARLQQASMPPAWSDVINRHEIIFVGFGFNKSNDGDLVGIGVKREASWNVNKADDWRFYFNSANSTGPNTCSGDSGGPAFYLDNQQNLLLVGITSVGDADCTSGADTRIDTHFAWVAKLLK